MPAGEKSYQFNRSFTCDGEMCKIGISIPELCENGDYICVYEIMISQETKVREAYGVDAIQAFLMAILQAGSFLYSGKSIDPSKTFWLTPDDMGYLGLPISIEDQGKILSGPKLILAI